MAMRIEGASFAPKTKTVSADLFRKPSGVLKPVWGPLKPGATAIQPNGAIMTSSAPTQNRIAPAAVTPPATANDGGGGGGGGGGGAAAAPKVPSVPKMNLQDFINSHFLYKSQLNENERDMEDFEAETLAGEQDVEADQAVRTQGLERQLDRRGQSLAEDFASRGLGRSGMIFKEQDDIDYEGELQRGSIADLLTNFVKDRGNQKKEQERANRAALASRIQEITSEFDKQNQSQLAV